MPNLTSHDQNENSVKIDKQIWSLKNLDVAAFRNWDVIPEIKTESEWKSAGFDEKPACCCFGNDPINRKKYGLSYNWYAVMDPRGICPESWHIPSDKDWITLINSIGGCSTSANCLKSTSGWSEMPLSNNVSQFSALPGGSRSGNGTFYEEDIGRVGLWWSSTHISKAAALVRWMKRDDNYVYADEYNKGMGLSVRCKK